MLSQLELLRRFTPDSIITGRPGASAHRPMGPAARAKRGSLRKAHQGENGRQLPLGDCISYQYVPTATTSKRGYRALTHVPEASINDGYKRTVLQTREIMEDAIGLYKKLGYTQIDNYPPYDRLDGAICFAKEL